MNEELIVERAAAVDSYAVIIWEDEHIAGHLLSHKYFPSVAVSTTIIPEDEVVIVKTQ